jgi:hypothetical protein
MKEAGMDRNGLLRLIPDDRGAERAALLAEERYWDAVVLEEPLPADAIDPDVAITIRQIHALDDAPLPDAGFAARLERDLLQSDLPAPSAFATATPPTATPVPDIASVSTGWPNVTVRRTVMNLAAMAALLAIVATSILVTLRAGPLATPDRTEDPLTLGPGITNETLLLSARFDRFPDGILSASVDRWVLQPGAEVLTGSQETSSEGPSAYLIETGTLTVRPNSPMTVIRTGSTTPAPVVAASQIELHVGDQGFAPFGVTSLWRNTGTVPVRIVEAKVKRNDVATSAEGVLDYSVIAESPFAKPDHPIVMTVRQVTLQPGAELSASTVPGLEMLKVEAGRLVMVNVDGDGHATAPILLSDATRLLGSFPAGRVFRSGNDQPVSLLLVTIADAHPLGAGG